MIRIYAPALSLLATPVIAHDGAHLHPHGAGNALTLVLALVLIAAASALWMTRK